MSKTSSLSLYLGKVYMSKVVTIAVDLTIERKQPVSKEDAGKHIIDSYKHLAALLEACAVVSARLAQIAYDGKTLHEFFDAGSMKEIMQVITDIEGI